MRLYIQNRSTLGQCSGVSRSALVFSLRHAAALTTRTQLESRGQVHACASSVPSTSAGNTSPKVDTAQCILTLERKMQK